MHKLTWKIEGVTQSLIVDNLNEVAYMGKRPTGNYILMFYEDVFSSDFSWDKKPAGWDQLYQDFNERNL